MHASDEVRMPKKYPSFALFNLSTRDSVDGGTHWVARYAAGPDRVYWYDSYARPIDRIMPSATGEDTDLSANVNDQAIVAKDCGQRSLAGLLVADTRRRRFSCYVIN